MDSPNSTENKEQWQPGLDGLHLLEPEDPRRDAVLEHQNQQAVGGAGRQQVQQHPKQRDHHRSEHHHQQQERQPQHEGEHDRGVPGGEIEEVHRAGGRPSHQDVGVDAGEHRGDGVGPQLPDGGEGVLAVRNARYRDSHQRQVPSRVDLHRARAEGPVGGQRPLESHDGLPHGTGHDRSVHHDLCRLGQPAGEVPGQHGERLLGLDVVRVGADAGEPDLDAQRRDGRSQQQTRAEPQADGGSRHNPVGRAGPEAGGVVHVLPASANKRHAQRVHPVSHHAEQRGEQSERRNHGDQNDRDGAGGQTAEDEVGDQQHPDQGQHNGHPRKEHRPVGRGTRAGDRIDGDRTMTISVECRGPLSRCSSSVCAWSDSGLFADRVWVVSAPLSRPEVSRPPMASNTSHPPITRHG
jgi:hypothetical protein